MDAAAERAPSARPSFAWPELTARPKVFPSRVPKHIKLLVRLTPEDLGDEEEAILLYIDASADLLHPFSDLEWIETVRHGRYNHAMTFLQSMADAFRAVDRPFAHRQVIQPSYQPGKRYPTPQTLAQESAQYAREGEPISFAGQDVSLAFPAFDEAPVQQMAEELAKIHGMGPRAIEAIAFRMGLPDYAVVQRLIADHRREMLAIEAIFERRRAPKPKIF